MANVKAQVELVGSLSLTVRGVTFERGKPKTITNPTDIARYRTIAGLSVTEVDDRPGKAPKSKPAKASVPPPAGKKSKSTPPPAAVDEDEDEDEELDEEDDEDEGEDDDVDVGEVDGDGEADEPARVLTKTELGKLSKPVLVTFAKTKLGLELNKDDSKPDLIKAIMKAQIAAAKG